MAGPITLFGPLTIVYLLFSIVLSVSMKFSPGGRSPPAWLFQNPRWPPRTYKSMILHNVRSKYSIMALLGLDYYVFNDMEFDYNVNLVFDCHFYGKKFQDGCQITRKNS